MYMINEINNDKTLLKKDFKNKYVYLENLKNVIEIDYEHTQIFYISDVHLEHIIRNKFGDEISKEEAYSYIKYLVRSMVESVNTKQYNSYILIAGDTSSVFEYSVVFYSELVKYWNPNNIVVVLGNHELWDPYISMEKNIAVYRDFFNKLGIIFLQNDLMFLKDEKFEIIRETDILRMGENEIRKIAQYSYFIILGGIGFSGLDKEFNASKIKFGKSFDELPAESALYKDIEEAERFNKVYKKISKSLFKNRVIVLTHIRKEDWNFDVHNPYWIYLNGHDHHNYYEISGSKTVYADNQIGYMAINIGLKYFYCDNDYDIFAYYNDGIHKISREKYIDFNRKKLINMSFNRNDGVIYMLKRNNVYMFLMYCKFSESSKHKYLYLMSGGKLLKLEKNSLEDLNYYYENIEKYVQKIKRFFEKYNSQQKKVSEFVKQLGGYGKIHGCIIDIEKPIFSGYSYYHLFINPIDGKITPYYAEDITERKVFKDFKTLLQSSNLCKVMFDNYLMFEKECFNKNLPVFNYSKHKWKWGKRGYKYDNGNDIYKISRIVKGFQYCTEKNIIRLWNDLLLNYNFNTLISQEKKNSKIFGAKFYDDITE